MIIRISMIFLTILAIFFAFVFGIGYYLSGPKHTGPATEHFTGEVFLNPGNAKAKGFGDVLQWMLKRKQGPWVEDTLSQPGPKPADVVTEGAKITFVNHSTFLIQTRGANILTDPIWSERTSPFSWAGPKRIRRPGLRFEDLPRIDLVLISHNHYDHLDIQTLRGLKERDNPQVVSPLGVSALLKENGIHSVSELDWWQSLVVKGVEVAAVPAQHFSGRGLFDRDATLWCGYTLKLDSGFLYFAGDTGYNDQTFKEIGARFAPIEVALVPIGAYKPEWFMSPIHCSPAEALQIHDDLQSKVSIGIHFGTFPLADDGQHEPVEELQRAIREKGMSADVFRVLKEGIPFDWPHRLP